MTSSLYARILRANDDIRPAALVTPLEHSPYLSDLTGCQVFLKCENLQRTGSFKIRGAMNKVHQLRSTGLARGIVTASSGNHGQGVAWAGQSADIPVTVYASASASPMKLEAVRAWGARVVLLDETPLVVEMEARRRAGIDGKTFISPYNDIDVIAGQGTVGIEIAEQAAKLGVRIDAIFASVGGGGLISGIGAALNQRSPHSRIIGCWASRAASLYESLIRGKIIDCTEFPTISDGTAGGIEPGAITFNIADQILDEKILVDEEKIAAAMRVVARSDKYLIEGAAGVALGGFIQAAPNIKGCNVVVVLCGRNIEAKTFNEVTA